MKHSIGVTLAASLALVSGLASAGTTKVEPSLVLVVPSTYAFVKTAQNLATLRPITVVCYSATNNAAMFLWDAKNAKWSPLDAEALASGTGFGASSHVIVMGTDVSIVNMLAASVKTWATRTTSLPKFDLVKALNAANETLHYSNSEWEWLSAHYSLSFKDDNEQRRRYGKYGVPKEHKKPAPAKTPSAPAVDVVLPELVPAPGPAAVPSPVSPAPAEVAAPAAAAAPAPAATPVPPAAPAEAAKTGPGK